MKLYKVRGKMTFLKSEKYEKKEKKMIAMKTKKYNVKIHTYNNKITNVGLALHAGLEEKGLPQIQQVSTWRG